MTGTLLGVWAHPDDETFLSSGLILAARERGDRVVLVTATRGEQGTDDPGRWPPERLGRLRERELEAALAVLGVDEHRFLGYGDGACTTAAEPLAARAIATVIEEVRPDTIVTFGPDGVTGHADHRAVGRWTTRARNAVAPEAELLRAVLAPGFTRRFAAVNDAFGVFMDDPADDVDPGLHLRLEGDRLDRKIEAMLAQDSQTRRLVDGVGIATFRRWWAEEAFLVDRPVAVAAA
ncbi:LmbE family N-acetylglucosaminyl deacetylase [Actinomycetospora succinea]|uniref:LmbE family N-acetylglucosaminyl deacetylase n=1 Tax=Actinomycetospora succinea TaxID=663603 RepID=A0A4R6VIW3_9PSEU|nr:PIG-L family deacetylase [Actinomycetospora succinea]TDQ62756.1 LmbE family N-acetylglucosaminyl deacetylase [Actinomycetospora succinea]